MLLSLLLRNSNILGGTQVLHVLRPAAFSSSSVEGLISSTSRPNVSPDTSSAGSYAVPRTQFASLPSGPDPHGQSPQQQEPAPPQAWGSQPVAAPTLLSSSGMLQPRLPSLLAQRQCQQVLQQLEGHRGTVLPGSTFPRSLQPQPQLQQQRGFFFIPSFQQLKEEFFSPDRAACSAVITANVASHILTAYNRQLFNKMVQVNYLLAKGEWYRLLTAPFLHGSILHLLGNMLAVHFLGPAVEHVAGKTAFAVVYLSSAVAGGLAHYYYGSWATSVLGSSGGIAGLFAAFVVYKLRNRAYVGFDQQDKEWVMQMVAINVVLGFLMSGQLAHTAHIGGLVGGAVAMLLVGPRFVRVNGRVVDRPLIPFFKDLP